MDSVIEGELRSLSARLRRLGPHPVDPSPVIRTAHPFHGVSIVLLRRLARAWAREHASVPAADVLRLADALWAAGIREEMVLGAMILGARPDALAILDPAMLRRWCREIDNWELADNLAAATLGPWLRAAPADRIAFCDDLSRSPDPWARRLGIVAAIELARTPDPARWWPRVQAIIARLAADREAAIPKAISWALRRFAATEARPQVEALLADPEVRLPALARREAATWLATGYKRDKRGQALP